MRKNYHKKVETLFISIKKIIKKTTALHEPFTNNEELKILYSCLKKNEISAVGNFNKKFSNLLSKYTGSKYVILTSSGSSALHISLKAIGLGEGNEVLIPSLNFVAGLNAVIYAGGTPHFIDICQKNLSVDTEYLEKYLNEVSVIKNGKCINTKTNKVIEAIIPVYIFGYPFEILKLKKICKKYKIKIVEDAAEALGTFIKKKHAGTFGQVGCLSFNGNKIITTGSGGAILTNNKKIYLFAKNEISNWKIKNKVELIYKKPSLNFRMADLNAALGYAQLKKINFFLKLKKNLFKKYEKIFDKFSLAELYKPNNFKNANNWLISIILKDNNKSLRKIFFKIAEQYKIPLRPIWYPLHKIKHYKRFPKSSLKNTNMIYKKIINLPSSAILGK